MQKESTFTENKILEQLDLAFNGIANSSFPTVDNEDIKYNFFIDLEHGYFETAGSKIHLYADENRWAVVFEKNGYQNRHNSAEIELNYVGNCVSFHTYKYPERKYITNSIRIILISPEEYERISCMDINDMETYESINPDSEEVNIRDVKVKIEHDYKKYENLGIKIQNNPKNLIRYGDLIRYINETNPNLVIATEEEIKTLLPKDLKKIMSIDSFYFSSIYNKEHPPSSQEIYQLIAKILMEKDSMLWKPTVPANNHWANWKSGHL